MSQNDAELFGQTATDSQDAVASEPTLSATETQRPTPISHQPDLARLLPAPIIPPTPGLRDAIIAPTDLAVRRASITRGGHAASRAATRAIHSGTTQQTGAGFADSYSIINSDRPRTKLGLKSIFVSGIAQFDRSCDLGYDATWLSTYTGAGTRIGNDIVNHENLGDASYNYTVKAFTEMARGATVTRNLRVVRTTEEERAEVAFIITYSRVMILSGPSTDKILDLTITGNGRVEPRSAVAALQSYLPLNRTCANYLCEVLTCGLARSNVTSFYIKLWLLFFHVAWAENFQLALGLVPIAAAENAVTYVSLSPGLADEVTSMGAIVSAISSGRLVLFEYEMSLPIRQLVLLAANGLPRFTTPAGHQVRQCLLDTFVAPRDPVLIVFNGAIIPVDPIVPTAASAHTAIMMLASRRREQAFAVAGFLRAATYYNRWAGFTEHGINQAFTGSLEWKRASWPQPLFSNSLLLLMSRFVSILFPYVTSCPLDSKSTSQNKHFLNFISCGVLAFNS